MWRYGARDWKIECWKSNMQIRNRWIDIINYWVKKQTKTESVRDMALLRFVWSWKLNWD